MSFIFLLIGCLIFTLPLSLLGNCKYNQLVKNGMEDDFGPLKTKWDVAIVYLSGWIIMAISAVIGLLLLRGFIFLFSEQGKF